MTWTRLGDDYADRMALAQADDYEMLVDVQLLIWCNRLLSDGFVPRAVLRSAVPVWELEDSDLLETMKALVEHGIWTEVKGGWQRDWSDQETAERVRARQAATRERQSTFRERSALCKAGDHSLCDRCEAVRTGKALGRNGVGNGVTNGVSSSVRNGVSNSAPSRPDPTLREGREKGQTSATPPPSLAKARSVVGSPPKEQPDDWMCEKPSEGYDRQNERMNDAYRRWSRSHTEEVMKAGGWSQAWDVWRDRGGWTEFKESERKMMREAGGRETWLVSQKGKK